MRDNTRKDLEKKLNEIWELAELIKKLTVKNSEESLDICEYCGKIKGLVDSISGVINYEQIYPV